MRHLYPCSIRACSDPGEDHADQRRDHAVEQDQGIGLEQRIQPQANIAGVCLTGKGAVKGWGDTAAMADESIEAARARMIAKRFGGAENARTGGKGSVRRKRKAQHKASSSGT